MPVQITITGDNAQEALQEIGGLAAALVGATPAKAEAETKPNRSTKKSDPVKESVKNNSVKETTSDEEAEASPEVESKTEGELVSLEDLRAAVQVAARAGFRDQVKAILTEFGYPNVSAVQQKDAAAIMAKLEAL